MAQEQVMVASITGSGSARGTALVRVTPAARGDETTTPVEAAAPAFGARLDRRADFLAHLLATREGLAQTRARRRAEPGEAAAAYAAMPARLRPVQSIELASA
jgi:hypothetical protein